MLLWSIWIYTCSWATFNSSSKASNMIELGLGDSYIWVSRCRRRVNTLLAQERRMWMYAMGTTSTCSARYSAALTYIPPLLTQTATRKMLPHKCEVHTICYLLCMSLVSLNNWWICRYQTLGFIDLVVHRDSYCLHSVRQTLHEKHQLQESNHCFCRPNSFVHFCP